MGLAKAIKGPCFFVAGKKRLNFFLPSGPRKQLSISQFRPTFPFKTLYQQMGGVFILQSPSIFYIFPFIPLSQ